jgi:hypothetical protein
VGTRPKTIFTDLRVSRRFNLSERIALDGILDVFNVFESVQCRGRQSAVHTGRQTTAAFDPRQLQIALKLSW